MVLLWKDQLIVDKMTYRFRDPKRYEIVVFPYQYQENTYYIKRIIGLPGETVQILSGMVYIDGMRLDEHYGNEIMENPGIAEEPLTLGEDEYFVLGDNRNNSSDSRASDVGLIHRKDLIGRAWIRADRESHNPLGESLHQLLPVLPGDLFLPRQFHR